MYMQIKKKSPINANIMYYSGIGIILHTLYNMNNSMVGIKDIKTII